MSDTPSENTRVTQAARPSLAEKTYSFSAGSNKNSLVKEYFDQVSSKSLKDPFSKLYKSEDGFNIIRPPLNPYALVKMLQENSYLVQVIQAMITNIYGFGYRLEYIGKEDDETSDEALQELQWLEELFDQPNTYCSFQELKERLGWDEYATGNAYLEVTRDVQGRIITLHHIPAPTMRISKIEDVDVVVTETITRYGKKIKTKSKKKFRRYAQLDEMGKKIWFKEFGDPRTIDPRTGKENPSLALENSATEVIHIAKYNGQSVYGIPLWYSQLPSVQGSRQAELTNLDFFENNGIPALAVLVSGGYLTQEAFDYMKSNFESIKGRGSTNKVLILEARGAVEDASNTGAVPVPTVTMKPLYGDRQSDGLFQEYEKQCRDKIRSVHRLPGAFTGDMDAITHASVKVAIEIAENQVFIPERNRFDDIVNGKVLANWNLKYFRYKSHPSSIVTAEDIINAIEEFNKAGAMTPNVAINILNEKLNSDIPRVKQFWGNMPIQLVENILKSNGDPDKSNFMVDAFQALECMSVEDLKKIDVMDTAQTTIEGEKNKGKIAVSKTKETIAGKKPDEE